MMSRRPHRYDTQARRSPILSSESAIHMEGLSSGAEILDETMELSTPLGKLGVPHMLMSPPPEEVLRTARGKHASDARLSATHTVQDGSASSLQEQTPRATKRKRLTSFATAGHSQLIVDGPSAGSPSMTTDATPNHKARKQSRKHVSFVSDSTTPTKSPSKLRKSASPTKRGLLQSPHMANPMADYIPPSPSKSRTPRHSITPMPLYEPPAEQFTPPREIMYTPAPMSKSSKRKSLGKTSTKKGSTKKGKLVLQIKKEPPEIDLNEPLPPASPSDDPLLLRGPPRSHRKPKRRSSRMTYARDTPPISSSPIKAPTGRETRLKDTEFTSLSFDTDDDDNGPLPAVFNFDFENGGADDWTDDDPQSEFDHTGEYTGKFKVMVVPTKVDPPSSCTRERQDAWGHPTSPYPWQNRFSPVPESPEAADTLYDLPSATESGTGINAEQLQLPDSPTLRLALRSTQPILPSTPADALSGSPSSDVLPPSSPPQDILHSASRDTHSWREPLGVLSDDQRGELTHEDERSVIPMNFDAESDLPIAESDAAVQYPPDTPYSEPLDTSTVNASRRIDHSSHKDVVEVIPSQIVTEEDEMEVDMPNDHILTPHQSSDLQQEQDQQEIPATLQEFPCTPCAFADGVSPKSGSPLSEGEELITPIGADHIAQPAGDAFSTPGLRYFSTHASSDHVSLAEPDFVEPLQMELLEQSAVHLSTDFSDSVIVDQAAVEESPSGQIVEPNQQLSSPEKTCTSEDISSPHEPTVTVCPLSPEEAEELEDAESVVRELSHEPDFRDDEDEGEDAICLPRSRSMSQMIPMSSPHNPFHVQSPHHAANQSSQATTSSPLPSLEGEASNQVPLHRGPPRQWPPTPAVGTVQMVTPLLHVAVDDEGEEFDYAEDPSIIKIISADPRAAARAAAILKMHKYESLDRSSSSISSAKRPSSAKHHDSDSLLKSVFKNSRRKSLSQSGVQKSSTQRRHTLGGVIGDKVIMPGSPVTTLPALLKEAETSLLVEEQSLHSPYIGSATPILHSGALTRTPVPAPFLVPFLTPSVVAPRIVNKGPRDWTKADWKLLDSCFTDERVLHKDDRGLASAESVDLESVVDRFVHVLGGEKALSQLGASWTRDQLLKRARALRRKQSSGNIAPSLRTPTLFPDESWTPSQEYNSLMSPATSTLGGLSASRPSILSSVARPSGLQYQVPVEYAQLLGEANAVANDHAKPLTEVQEESYAHDISHPEDSQVDDSATANRSADSSGSDLEPSTSSSNLGEEVEGVDTSHITPLLPGPASLSFASRMKGLIFSYLPRVSSSEPAPAHANQPDPRKSLPVPPPEVFQKPRPPITTPAPKVAPKPPHPKDLVHLHPAPSKPSMIPRPTHSQNPRRFIELHPVPPRPSSSSSTFPIDIPRGRRDSTASVKDLVKSFESMEKLQAAERVSLKQLELKRKRSVQEWTKSKAGDPKPSWRP